MPILPAKSRATSLSRQGLPPSVDIRAMFSPSLKQVKTLIWVYFWLLIFEGALRKWVAPALSNPLLLIRDPVAFLIYLQAIRGDFFPRNALVSAGIGLGFMTFMWGVTQSFGGSWVNLFVAAYGARCLFFHLPMIFIIGHVFTLNDVIKLGRWVLIISVPMIVLMVLQYQASPDNFLNKGTADKADGTGGQLIAALGHVRPAGTFSFISGPVFFFPLATIFWIMGFLRSSLYPKWLLLGAGASILLALPISGSRSLVGNCTFVFLMTLMAGFFQPKIIGRITICIVAIFLVGGAMLATPVGRQGAESFLTRWEQAGDAESGGEGASTGIARRFFGGFLEPLDYIDKIQFMGVGIGRGTNVGSQLLTGDLQFLAGEGEWTRLVLEGGPFLGLAHILFRVFLAFFLLYKGYRLLARGIYLPWLLVSSCFMNLVIGQTQQSTTLGFMVLVAGLSLAAVQGHEFAGADGQAALSTLNKRRREFMSRRLRLI